MAGKLGKLKCMLKRWHSRSRLHAGSPSAAVWSHDDENSPTGLHPVYVGRSRRRYLISSDLVGHPLFQVLTQRCVDPDGGAVVVDCEVVLFEHLLWMLENAEPPPESIDELVEFYACC
ncbi:hypothetical protein OPV22_003621 [Ensete ventricosum]|uniref:Uncharacterized protein n=1 Tax=Ensete ventricosum TaxID=4639 RepID=A0A426ZZL0_ENSVE|nr:hypothetical protein OPV22_003621 [Ensete ventricosum]RRT69410.1 hypothetical protein B296_00034020 [Ensete ventricosum]RWW02169.1 hypothetical protein GW17_00034754 [Ensete ventricosum]RZS12299.1 hypothetical protein BHM03_00043719 [Ensete ventricosum]